MIKKKIFLFFFLRALPLSAVFLSQPSLSLETADKMDFYGQTGHFWPVDLSATWRAQKKGLQDARLAEEPNTSFRLKSAQFQPSGLDQAPLELLAMYNRQNNGSSPSRVAIVGMFSPVFAAKADGNDGWKCEDKSFPKDYFDNLGIMRLNQEIASLQSARGRADNVSDDQRGSDLHKNSVQVCDEVIAHINSLVTQLQTCDESFKKLTDAKQKFNEACKGFAPGPIKCANAIQACAHCPTDVSVDEVRSDDDNKFDCVIIHERTECPAKAGTALEEAKKESKEVLEEIAEMEEEISEAERNIAEEEASLEEQRRDISEALAELAEDFSAQDKELRDNKEQLTDELDQSLREGKAQIEQGFQEQVAAVNQQIDNALKISHDIENAITQATTEYQNALIQIHSNDRKERRKIRSECEIQARGSLGEYRTRRREAISTGSYQESVSSLLSQGRASFAQRDSQKLERDYQRCLARRQADFRELTQLKTTLLESTETAYSQKLRVIEQQKEQYQQTLQSSREALVRLQADASQADQSLLTEYTENLEKILERHERTYHEAYTSYNAKRAQLVARSRSVIASGNDQIAILREQLGDKDRKLELKKMELTRWHELATQGQEAGIKEGDSSEEAYGDATAALSEYIDNNHAAEDACDCLENETEGESGHCKKIQGYKKYFTDEKHGEGPTGKSLNEIGGNR